MGSQVTIKRHQIRMWIKDGVKKGPVMILGECIGGPHGVFIDGWSVRRIPETDDGFHLWLPPEQVGPVMKITESLIEKLAKRFNAMEIIAFAASEG